MKQFRKFNFIIPVNDSRNPKVKIGDIEVDGTFEDREDYDYNFIKWSDGNLVTLFDNVSDVMDMVQNATVDHIYYLQTILPQELKEAI